MTQEALKLALEALKSCDAAHITDGGHQWYDENLVDKAITAIKEALAQPEQEPVTDDIASILACRDVLDAQPVPQRTEQEPVAFASHGVINWIADKQFQHEADLYTTPPQRKPLTDEEMKKIWYAMQNIMGWYSFQEIARAIEAAHGIRENT